MHKEAIIKMGAQYTPAVEAFCSKNFRLTREFTGQDIRIARKAFRFSQEQLADELKIAVRTIEKWEHNLHCPSPSLHKELLKLFIKAQEILSQRIVPPSLMENIEWQPKHCKPYNLVCRFKNI